MQKLSISYNNSSPQIYSFDLSTKGLEVQKENFELCAKFLDKISSGKKEEINNYNTLIKNVPAGDIIDFINQFIYSKTSSGYGILRP